MAQHTMPQLASLVTTVSTKGQLILPKAVRQRRDWSAGTLLIVEEAGAAHGVLAALVRR